LCDEHGIGGGGEYCGDNNPQLGRINVFYHHVSGGKYVPHAVHMDLEPGVIGAVTQSRDSARSPARKKLVNQNAGAGSNLAKGR
jgi:tubulin beta